MSEAKGNSADDPHTEGKTVFGRHYMPWTEEEITFLKSVAHKRCSRKMLATAIPDRSIKAIGKKLSDVRGELGIKNPSTNPKKKRGSMLAAHDDGLGDGELNRWRRNAARSNAKFLAALQRALAA